MLFVFYSFLAALGMFATSVAFQMLGRRLGSRSSGPRNDAAALSAVETAVFGLLGLLPAFTFSGAVSRFDERRQAMAEEANAIAAAYRNLDLLPGEAKSALRTLFQDYLTTRLEESRLPHGFFEYEGTSERSSRFHNVIWDQAVNATRAPVQEDVAQVLLPSINQMFSIARSRNALAHRHPPLIIFVVLLAFAAAGSLLAGHAMAAQSTVSSVHILSLAAALSLSVYLILEIEFPRQGIVRLDAYDGVLADVLNGRR